MISMRRVTVKKKSEPEAASLPGVPMSQFLKPETLDERAGVRMLATAQPGDWLEARVCRSKFRRVQAKPQRLYWWDEKRGGYRLRTRAPNTHKIVGREYEWMRAQIVSINDPASVTCRTENGVEFKVGVLRVRPCSVRREV